MYAFQVKYSMKWLSGPYKGLSFFAHVGEATMESANRWKDIADSKRVLKAYGNTGKYLVEDVAITDMRKCAA